MRCSLFLPMFAVSVRQSVCLSCSSSRLYCAKMAEQVKMLFGVRRGSWSPYRKGKGPTFKFWEPPPISGTAEARDMKFCMHIHGCGSYQKLHKVGYSGIPGGVMWPTFKFCDCLHLRNGYSYRVLCMQCVRCIQCSLCQITLASCFICSTKSST